MGPGWERKGARTPPNGGGPAEDCELLQLDGGAGLFELALELVGFLALDALLDGLRRLVDERLGLLEAEAGGGPDDLDHLDLLVAGAGEHHVDRRGLLLGGCTVAATATGGRSGRRPR